MNALPAPRRQTHFTLIELMFVVGVVAVLLALLLPALTQAKQSANHARVIQMRKQYSQDPHCVLYYNFENVTASGDVKNEAWYTAADDKGIQFEREKLSASIVAPTAFTTDAGRFQGETGADFSGSGGWMYISQNQQTPAMEFDKEVTIEMWVNVTNNTYSGFLNSYLAAYRENNPGFLFYVNHYGSAGKVAPAMGVYTEGSAGFEWMIPASNQTEMQHGVWGHLVATFDGETIRCYANGKEVGSTVVSTPGEMIKNDGPNAGDSEFIVGIDLDNADCLGMISELAIFDRALTPVEIKDHYLGTRK